MDDCPYCCGGHPTLTCPPKRQRVDVERWMLAAYRERQGRRANRLMTIVDGEFVPAATVPEQEKLKSEWLHFLAQWPVLPEDCYGSD